MNARLQKIKKLFAASHDLVMTMGGKTGADLFDMLTNELTEEELLFSCEDLTDEDIEIGINNALLLTQAFKDGGHVLFQAKSMELIKNSDPEFTKRTILSNVKMAPVYRKIAEKLLDEDVA